MIAILQPARCPPPLVARTGPAETGRRAAALLAAALLGLLALLALESPLRAEPVDPAAREFFEKRVRPILAENCFKCHSRRAETLQAGLYLDSRQGMLQGGDSGPAIVAGDASSSLLMEAIRYESFEMPPSGPLDEEMIEAIGKWIDLGAPWPDEGGEPQAAVASSGFDWQARKAAHWAWRPLQPTPVPQIPRDRWSAGPIDRFILQALEREGLPPAAEAPRSTLIRRAYLDLIGLPPSVEELERWERQTAPDWYEQMVDQLLASPQFGEKWGRHWLDLVRYAETYGHEFDYPIPFAYRYRDYVIRAWNADVPYDQFVREHLAGDLLPQPRRHPQVGYNESILGTGFWFLGESVHAPTDVLADEADRIDNQIDVLTKTFLGLTVACARCHDHKFDPIPTKDYYALAGFLQSSRRQVALLDPGGRIAAQAQVIERVRSEADGRARSRWVPAAAQWPLAEELAGVRRAARGERAGDTAQAGPASLDGILAGQTAAVAWLRRPPERLGAWQRALSDRQAGDPAHPLYFVRELLAVDESGFAERARQLATAIERRRKKVQTAREGMERFADFATDLDQWRATGQAFSDRPTSGQECDWWLDPPQWSLPGSAHSGLRGRRLEGVLRSPTFELKHRKIHYHLQGEDVQIRLIVDGYFMDQFNQLLFADCTLDKVDTGGRFAWVTQSKDLDHYLGHRAHLEIHDGGAGYAAIDQIWFSDGPPPPAEPHPWSEQLAADPPTTWQDLADAIGGLWQASLQRIQDGRPTSGDIRAANELLRWGLAPGPLPAAAADGSALETHATSAGPAPPGEATVALRLARLDAQTPLPMQALAITEGSGEDERIHIRGSAHNLGDVAPRRMLVAIAGTEQPPLGDGSGRLELARRMTDPANPFLPRVIVNRIWHHLFGRGIVPTVDDFGVMGEPPTHPELLDWLATDLVQHGWSLKHTIRAVVTSRTYRMDSTAGDPRVLEQDPQNVWLARAPLRRLTAETLRDSLLVLSGRLDPTMFGPSVPTHLTPFMTGRGRPRSGPLDGDGRRSIYLEVRRNFLSPWMLTFDMPIPFSTMGRRAVSNVPAQSLTLMNDPLAHELARGWADRLLALPVSDDQRVERMYREALARGPSDEERAAIAAFWERQQRLYGGSAGARELWTDLCHAMFNLKEFLYPR